VNAFSLEEAPLTSQYKLAKKVDDHLDLFFLIYIPAQI
jgi:hypothetical protein